LKYANGDTHSYKKDWEKNFMGNDPGALLYGLWVDRAGEREERRNSGVVCNGVDQLIGQVVLARMFSSRVRSTVAEVAYVLVVIITAGFFTISCVVLLSQAVRTAPNRSWAQNFNALIIGTSYVIVVGLFTFFMEVLSH